MVEYVWPDRADTSVLGKGHDKIDGVAKCSGAAKYSYDINPERMLLALHVFCLLPCGVRRVLPLRVCHGLPTRDRRRRR